MRYVVSGYVIVLSLLFLYVVQLAWRRRRLEGAVRRVLAASPSPVPDHEPDPDPDAEPEPHPDPERVPR